MKLVAISNLAPRDTFVLGPVHERWPLSCVIQPAWNAHTTIPARWSKLITNPTETINRRLQRAFRKGRERQLDRQVAITLFGAALAPAISTPRFVISHRDINSQETSALIQAAEPDLMLLCSSPIIDRQLFTIPRFGTINIHWGIAPRYRGENTLFWPLYFKDYANIGVTIHRVDEGIDTGRVLAQGFPEIEPDDDEGTLFAKCSRLAASLLVDVLAQIETRHIVDGSAQQTRGRLFLARDRSLWHDVAYWAKRSLGRCQPPERAMRRITLFQRVA